MVFLVKWNFMYKMQYVDANIARTKEPRNMINLREEFKSLRLCFAMVVLNFNNHSSFIIILIHIMQFCVFLITYFYNLIYIL